MERQCRRVPAQQPYRPDRPAQDAAQHVPAPVVARGDPVADDILQALKNAGEDGMTRTNIRDFFGRHQSASRIEAALATLLGKGMVRMEGKVSGGRPTEVWYATKAT